MSSFTLSLSLWCTSFPFGTGPLCCPQTTTARYLHTFGSAVFTNALLDPYLSILNVTDPTGSLFLGMSPFRNSVEGDRWTPLACSLDHGICPLGNPNLRSRTVFPLLTPRHRFEQNRTRPKRYALNSNSFPQPSQFISMPEIVTCGAWNCSNSAAV